MATTTTTNKNSRLQLIVSLVLSLLLPLQVAASTHAATACFVTPSPHCQTTSSRTTRLLVRSGFSFQDGEQLLVSVHISLEIILEERQAREQQKYDSDDDGSDETAGTLIFVAEMDPAGLASRADVLRGDALLAVQNPRVENRSYIMALLAQAP
jgi:hypothetical protein